MLFRDEMSERKRKARTLTECNGNRALREKVYGTEGYLKELKTSTVSSTG